MGPAARAAGSLARVRAGPTEIAELALPPGSASH